MILLGWFVNKNLKKDDMGKRQKYFKPPVQITAVIMYVRPEAHSGPRQNYKIELLKAVDPNLNLLTIFV